MFPRSLCRGRMPGRAYLLGASRRPPRSLLRLGLNPPTPVPADGRWCPVGSPRAVLDRSMLAPGVALERMKTGRRLASA